VATQNEFEVTTGGSELTPEQEQALVDFMSIEPPEVTAPAYSAPKLKTAETPDALMGAYPNIGDPKLAEKIVEVSNNLDMPPAALAGVIDLETGGSFDPAQLNLAGSGAVGLIQFMGSTARGLLHDAGEEGFAPSKYQNTTNYREVKAEDRFRAMGAVEQMGWVERYLKPYKGRLDTIEDVGMAVFYPKAIGNPDYNIAADYDRIGPGTGARFRKQNPGIETAGDYMNKLRGRAVTSFRQRGPVEEPEKPKFEETRIAPPGKIPDPELAEALLEKLRIQKKSELEIQFPLFNDEEINAKADEFVRQHRMIPTMEFRGLRAATTRISPISSEPVLSSFAARLHGLREKQSEIKATLKDHFDRGEYVKGVAAASTIAHTGMLPSEGTPLEEMDPELEAWTKEGEEKGLEIGYTLPATGLVVGGYLGGFTGAMLGVGVGALAGAEWNTEERFIEDAAKRLAYIAEIPALSLKLEKLGSRATASIVDSVVGAAETLGVENPQQYVESARQTLEDWSETMERREQAGLRGSSLPETALDLVIFGPAATPLRESLEDALLRISQTALLDEAGRKEIFEDRERYIRGARLTENVRGVYEVARKMKENPDKAEEHQAELVFLMNTLTFSDLEDQGLANAELDVEGFKAAASDLDSDEVSELQLDVFAPALTQAIRAVHEDKTDKEIDALLKDVPVGTLAHIQPIDELVPSMEQMEKWAEEKVDIVSETGGTATRQLENWAKRKFMSVEKRDGTYYVVESTTGKIFRWAGGFATEAILTPLELAIKGHTGFGVVNDPDSLLDIPALYFARIGTGEIGVQPRVLDMLKTAGVKRDTLEYLFANLASIAADFLIPFETPFISAAGRTARVGAIQPIQGARLAATGRPYGMGGQGFLAGALPSVYKYRHGLRDKDAPTSVHHFHKALADTAVAQGKNPLDVLPRKVKDNVIEALRVFGVDPDNAMQAYSQHVLDSGSVHGRAVDIAARGETPGDVTMREGDGYRQFVETLDTFAQQRKWDARANPMIQAVFETLAGRLASDPDVPNINTPQDFFENVIRLQEGGEPGPFARYQIADDIPDLNPVEYKVALGAMSKLADLDVPKGLRSLEHDFTKTRRGSRGQKIASGAAEYVKFNEYRALIEDSLRSSFGDEFNVYSLMPKEMLASWRGGRLDGPISTSLTPEGAHALKRHHPVKQHEDLVLVEIKARPEDAWMIGSLDDLEVVMSMQGKPTKNLKGYPLGLQDSGSVRPVSVDDIRGVGKDARIDVDSDRYFLDLLNKMTGKSTVDDLTASEREAVLQGILNGSLNAKYRPGKKKAPKVSWTKKQLDELTAEERKHAEEVMKEEAARKKAENEERGAELKRLQEIYLVKSPDNTGVPETLTQRSRASMKGFGKPIALGTTVKNAVRSFARLDEITAKLGGRNPLESNSLWNGYWSEVTGEKVVMQPPHKVVEYLADPQNIADTLGTLSNKQISMADGGVDITQRIGSLYRTGKADITTTGQMVLWSILSRTLSSYPHESGFIDSFMSNVKPFIKAAAEGKFDSEMLDRYRVWVGASQTKAEIASLRTQGKKPSKKTREIALERLLESGAITEAEAESLRLTPPAIRDSGPGQPSVFNLNGFGDQFLYKAGKFLPDGHPHAGKTALNVLHEMLMDDSISSKQIRREWHGMVHKSGVDNKILSFLIMVSGRTDVIVIDRVQANHFWDITNRKYGRGIKDLYEGFAKKTTKAAWDLWMANPRDFSSKRGLADVLGGARGLALYEVIEDALLKNIAEGYRLAGRGDVGSVSRFHWESWVASSGQEVGHGTLAILLRDALGVQEPARGVYVREGKFAMKRYGIKYVPFEDGSRVYVMEDSVGRPYVLDSEAFTEYNKILDKHAKNKNIKNRVVPRGFLISDPSAAGIPWFHRTGVNRANLDRLIAKIGRRATLKEALLLKARADRNYGVVEYPGQRLDDRVAPLRIAFGDPPPAKEVVVEAALTGVQAARPELEVLKERFLSVANSIAEAKAKGGPTATLSAKLERIESTIFSGFEPALRDVLDEPGIEIVSLKRGLGGWGAEELEPNIRVQLVGDEALIRDRLAKFNSTSGMSGDDAVSQGGALSRVFVEVIEDAPDVIGKPLDRSVLSQLVWDDGGVERLATLRIGMPDEMLTPEGLAELGPVLKKHSIGFTVDRGLGTLELTHTPEWNSMNAGDTFDVFLLAAREFMDVARKQHGSDIEVAWVKERVLISAPEAGKVSVNNALDTGVSEYKITSYQQEFTDGIRETGRVQEGLGEGVGERSGTGRLGDAATREAGLEPLEAGDGRGLRESVGGEVAREGGAAGGDAGIRGPEEQRPPVVEEEPTDPRIRYQRRAGRALGYFEWDQASAKYVIALFRDGDLNTLWHEQGHLVSAIMGDQWMDRLVRYFDHEVSPDGAYRLSDIGEEQLADAWMSYMQTRFSPSGPVKRLFEQLMWTLKEVWRRLRGKDPAVPAEMRRLWDGWLRPDLRGERYAIDVQDAVMRKRHPVVALEDTPAERIEAEAVKKAGRAREFARVDLRPESVRTALGGKMEIVMEDISPDPDVPELAPRRRPVTGEVDAVELVNNAIAYVATEHFKRSIIGEEWVRLTLRTHIPMARMANVQNAVRTRLIDAIGSQPKHLKYYNKGATLPPEVSARIGSQTGLVARIDNDIIDLSPAQAAGMKTLVQEIASEPLANILPDALLYPDADFRTMTVQQYNTVLEVLVDVESGVASRATRYAENISPTLAHAMINAMKTAANFAIKDINALKSIRDKIKESFVVPRFAEGYIDPTTREIVETSIRELGTVDRWLLNMADRAVKTDDATTWRGIYQSMVGQLVAPVDPGQTSQLFDMVRRFGGVLEAEAGRVARVELGEIGAGYEMIQMTRMELYGRLDAIQGLLQNSNGLSDMERKALRLLRTYERVPIEELSDADLYAIGDAIKHIHGGLLSRRDAVVQRAKELAMGLEGSSDANLASEMNLLEYREIYDHFYRGDFEWLFDFTGRKGRELNADPTTIAEYDQSVAVLEMIARMRADEIIGQMSRRLAEYGITSDVTKVTEFRKFGPGTSLDRDKFIDSVAFYINKEMNWDQNTFLYKQSGRISPPPAPISDGTYAIHEMPEGSGPGRFGIGTHDMLAYTKAHELIAQWGFKLGKGKWERYTMPDGTSTMVPMMVMKEIEDAVSRAAAVGYAWGNKSKTLRSTRGNVALDRPTKKPTKVQAQMMLSKAFDTIMDMNPITASRIKMGVTTGIGVPNPAYFAGVSLGALFQAYQTQGAYAAGKYLVRAPITALRVLGRRPDMVGAVTARMWKEGGYAPHAPAIVTKFGQVYTDDMVGHLAIREGMKSSFIHAETTQAIAKDIEQKMPQFMGWARKFPKWWQNNLIEVSTAIDNYFRVSIFVDELAMGKSPSAAAAIARKAGFDYADLTEFERKTMRNVIMFYSYQRKNLDLFWDTFLRNPQRLIAQMRLIRGSQRLVLDEDDPMVIFREHMHTRLFAGSVNSFYNAHFNSGMAFVLPMLPVEDAIRLLADLYDAAAFEGTERGQEAYRGLVSRTTPWVQGPFVLAGEKDFYFGHDINRNNVVPGWLMELDFNLTGGLLYQWLNVKPTKVKNKAYEEAPGRLQFVAQNGSNWWLWRNMMQFPGAGRSMQTFTAMDRANLGPVEILVELSNLAREVLRSPLEDVGWLDAPKGGRKVTPYEELPEEWRKETMLPRPDLYEGDPTDFAILEFLGLMGARPKAMKRPYVRAGELFERKRYELERTTKEMERSDVL